MFLGVNWAWAAGFAMLGDTTWCGSGNLQARRKAGMMLGALRLDPPTLRQPCCLYSAIHWGKQTSFCATHHVQDYAVQIGPDGDQECDDDDLLRVSLEGKQTPRACGEDTHLRGQEQTYALALRALASQLAMQGGMKI